MKKILLISAFALLLLTGCNEEKTTTETKTEAATTAPVVTEKVEEVKSAVVEKTEEVKDAVVEKTQEK